MTQINAYLNFNGNCREAMTFYRDCFGGELELQTIAGSPMDGQLPYLPGDAILHSSLTRGNLVLMGSDMMGASVMKGNNVNLLLQCASTEEIQAFFDRLSAGGEVSHPLSLSFWGSTFGHLTDRFGLHWMLNYEQRPKQPAVAEA